MGGKGGNDDDADAAPAAGPGLRVGQRVRVTSDAQLMHVPGHKEGFVAQGVEGTVARIYTEENLSANCRVKVQFEEPKKWVAHFEAFEVEALD